MKVLIFLLLCMGAQKIRKGASDSRDYKYFEHSSETRVFVTEDSKTQTCGARFHCGVGYLKDPSDRIGLTGILNVNLLLGGSKKYPKHYHFHNFIKSKGGSSNSSYGRDSIEVYFEINCDDFDMAFDMAFWQFISPVFDDELINKEITTAEAHRKKFLEDDSNKAAWLYGLLSNPQTSYKNTWVAEVENLRKPGMKEALQDFHKKYFRPSTFIVSLYGKDFKALEKVFNTSFADLKPDDSPDITYDSENFYTSAQLGKFAEVKTNQSQAFLTVHVPFGKAEQALPSNPVRFLSYLVESPHEGGLTDNLQKRGWATALTSFLEESLENYSELHVEVKLTTQGFEHEEEVISLFFTYIQFLTDNFQMYLYNDYRLERMIQFNYFQNASIEDTMSKSITQLNNYGFQRALSAPYDFELGSKEELLAVFKLVKPENAIVMLSGASIDKTDLKEPKYGISYSLGSLESSKIASDGMKLPPAAAYTVSLEELKKMTLPSAELQAVTDPKPQLITPDADQNIARLWHYRDTTFGQPLFVLSCNLILDEAFVTGSVNAAARQIIESAFSNEVRKQSSKAELIGVTLSFSQDDQGMQFMLRGVSTSLAASTDTLIGLLQALMTLRVSKEDFEKFRLSHLGSAEDQCKNPQHFYAYQSWREIGIDGELNGAQRVEAFKRAKLAHVEEYIQSFSKKMFVEFLITGSVSREVALSTFTKVTDTLRQKLTNSIKPHELRIFSMKTPLTLLLPYPLSDSQISSVNIVYCLGSGTEWAAFGSILGAFIRSGFLEEFRKNQDMGYYVDAAFRDEEDYQFFSFTVETSAFKGDVIAAKILEYVEKAGRELAELKESDYANMQAGVKAIMNQPLTGVFAQYNFVRNKAEVDNHPLRSLDAIVKSIDELKLETFIKTFKKCIIEQPQRLTLVFAGKPVLDAIRAGFEKGRAAGEKVYTTLESYQADHETYPVAFPTANKLKH